MVAGVGMKEAGPIGAEALPAGREAEPSGPTTSFKAWLGDTEAGALLLRCRVVGLTEWSTPTEAWYVELVGGVATGMLEEGELGWWVGDVERTRSVLEAGVEQRVKAVIEERLAQEALW